MNTIYLSFAPRVLALVALAWTASAPGRALDRVVLNYRNEVTSIDVLIAIEEGFFAAEGIEVEAVPWSGSDALLPALAQGKIDAGTSGPFGPSYVNVIQRGARVRLVRARSVHAAGAPCSYQAYVARNELIDSGRLDSIASLRGLRISTDRVSGSLYFWERLLAQGGLTIDDVETMDLPTNARSIALARNLVDVVELTEPRISIALSSGHGKVWRGVNQAVPDHQSTFLVFGPRLLDQGRELGSRVMRAVTRGVRQYLEQGKSDRNVEIVSRLTRMSPEQVRGLCWPTFSADGRIDPESLMNLQEWALAGGLIDAMVPVQDLVDEGFLAGAR